jgi:hypothetical protein
MGLRDLELVGKRLGTILVVGRAYGNDLGIYKG